MKKLLLLLFVFIISINVFAQKFTVGLKAGLNYNTAPLGLKSQKLRNGAKEFSNTSGGISELLGIKFGIDMKRVQLGVGLDYSTIAFMYEVQTNYTMQYSVILPFLTPYAFINFKTSLPRSFIYYGVNAGYMNLMRNRARFGVEDNYPTPTPYTFAYPGSANNFHGGYFVFGAQVGYTFKIAKGLSINAETGIRYTPFHASLGVYDTMFYPTVSLGKEGGILSIPLTAGINYTF